MSIFPGIYLCLSNLFYILRISDEMRPTGQFYTETESGNNMVDFKPKRPSINKIKDSMTR